MFSITTIIIYILGMLISWWVLFTLFTSKSHQTVALAVTIIVLLFSPFIMSVSYNIYAIVSRSLFVINESGELQLTHSPLRIPEKYKGIDYCNRFKDQSGRPIYLVQARDDGSYCGSYWGFYKEKTIFIPYKKLSDGKIKFWTAPGAIIIGNSAENLFLR